MAGVFEGGGAKGVAYVGSLEAVRDQGCWFSAVAGSSAGALTATLIAAGLGPDEIARATDDLLGVVRRHWEPADGRLLAVRRYWLRTRAVLRLRYGSQMLPTAELGEQLERILAQRVDGPLDQPVSFEELHERTGIELNIVSADLTAQRQRVFNHLLSPSQSVTEALLGSMAIPFVFPWREIGSTDDDSDGGRTPTHLIVDGGVWANFPLFVFSDDFRAWAHRSHPEFQTHIDSPVVGFLLDEDTEPAVDPHLERSSRRPQDRPGSNTFALTVSSLLSLLLAIVWLPAMFLVEFVKGFVRLPAIMLSDFFGRGIPEPPKSTPLRCKEPSSASGRLVYRTLDNLTSLASGSLTAGVFMGSFVALAFFSTVTQAWGSTQGESIFGQIGVWGFRAFLVWFAILGLVLAITIAMCSLLLPTLRPLGCGLVSTYYAGPGAPPWTRDAPSVIALPVGESITTMSFDIELAGDVAESLRRSAYAVTAERLPEIIAERSAAAE